MVTGEERFRNRGRAVCVKTGQQDTGLHLGGSHRRKIINGVQFSSCDGKRRAPIILQTADIRAHLTQRFHDPFHGTFLYGIVAGQLTGKVLAAQDAAEETGGGAAVSGIQHRLRFLQTMKAFSLNPDEGAFVFDGNSHLLKTGDG